MNILGQSTVIGSSTTALTKPIQLSPGVELLPKGFKIPADAISVSTTPRSNLPAVITESARGAGAGGAKPRFMLTPAMMKNPQFVKEITIKAAKHSESALGRVIAETAVNYPKQLEQVLKHSADADYYRTMHVVDRLYNTAKANGGEFKPFPTEQLTKAMYAKNVSHIFKAGLLGIPLDAAFKIFDYRSDKIKADEYVAKSLNGFGSWAAFEAGIIGGSAAASQILGRNISTFGRMSLGVGVGIVASSLYHRTAGHHVEEALTHVISEKDAKPVAEAIDKYFATPIDNYVIQPIKNNPKTSIAVGVGLATALTLKYPVGFGKNFLLGFAGATAIGTVGTVALNYMVPDPKQAEQEHPKPAHPNVTVIGSSELFAPPAAPAATEENQPAQNTQPHVVQPELTLPPLSQPTTQEELNWALALQEQYQANPESVTQEENQKYINILERFKAHKNP